MDGCVDGLDYIAWSNNYKQYDKQWQDGDFTGEGYVDGLDYIIWSNNYETGCPAVPLALGEPVENQVVGEALGVEHPAAATLSGLAALTAGEMSVGLLGPGGSVMLRTGRVEAAPDAGWVASAVPHAPHRAAAPAGVPEEVEPVLLTDAVTAGMRDSSRGLAALEDDLVDILGLAQLEAPLHA